MRPFLTIFHLIQEIIGVICSVASVVIAIVMTFTIKEQIPVHFDFAGNVDRYGSIGAVLIMPLILLPTILIMVAATHLFPLSLWSLPVKPKPSKEALIYRDSAYLVTLYTLQTGVYSLLYTCFYGFKKTFLLGPLSFALCVTMLLTAVVIFVKCIVENR